MLSIFSKMNGEICLSTLRYSDFWSFKTPIYDEWIKDPDARALLQKASSGQGSLPEELRQVLLEHVYCGCGGT